MKEKKTQTYVISANQLLTGEVVYLTRDWHWSTAYKDAHTVIAENPESALDTLPDDIDRVTVLDIVSQQLEEQHLTALPKKMRARMRLTGPSIRFGYDLQTTPISTRKAA